MCQEGRGTQLQLQYLLPGPRIGGHIAFRIAGMP